VQTRLRGAVRVAQGADYDLWRPAGTPRLAIFVGGLYADRWLAASGHLTVWAARGKHVRGRLRLRLSLPAGAERTLLQLRAPGYKRTIAVLPSRTQSLVVPVEGGRSWTMRFWTKRPGYLTDGRTISVKAKLPVFSSS
jgi:hypothetical protein